MEREVAVGQQKPQYFARHTRGLELQPQVTSHRLRIRIVTDTDDVRYDPEAGIIRVCYDTAGGTAAHLRRLDRVAELIEDTGVRRVLTVVKGRPPYLNRTERRQLAERARKSRMTRSAIVCESSMLRMLVRAIRFAAKTGHGATYFDDESTAVAWLQQDDEE